MNKETNTWIRPNLPTITKALIEMGDATMGEILGNCNSGKKLFGDDIPATKFYFYWPDGSKQEAIAYNESGETMINW
jgi:hypothetical protein